MAVTQFAYADLKLSNRIVASGAPLGVEETRAAVELASAYSTDDSGRFVNGVLATLAVQIRG